MAHIFYQDIVYLDDFLPQWYHLLEGLRDPKGIAPVNGSPLKMTQKQHGTKIYSRFCLSTMNSKHSCSRRPTLLNGYRKLSFKSILQTV